MEQREFEALGLSIQIPLREAVLRGASVSAALLVGRKPSLAESPALAAVARQDCSLRVASPQAA
jgi:hypothetical protein